MQNPLAAPVFAIMLLAATPSDLGNGILRSSFVAHGPGGRTLEGCGVHPGPHSCVVGRVLGRTRRVVLSAGDIGDVQDAVVISEAVNSTGRAARPPSLSAAAELRAALLAKLAALDRGARATAEDAVEVKRLADELAQEALREGQWVPRFPETLSELEGRWKLLYTSAFTPVAAGAGGVGGSLGGLRPGPPLDSPLLQVGDIYQRYRTADARVDTVVTLRPPEWLRETGLLDRLPWTQGNVDTEITLTQQFDIANATTLRFAFTDGQVANRFTEILAPLKFPMATLGLAPDTTRDGPFTDTLVTTYCDGQVRIGLGGRFGELRIFLRG